MLVTERDQVEALLAYGKEIDPTELFPVLVPEASEFVLDDPYAFAMAMCLDRGTKADIIWTIPYYIRQKIRHLNPYRIYTLSLKELQDLFNQLPRRPRYITDAPRTVRELTEIVITELDGDASKLWMGNSAGHVKATFQRIYGVGPGIASMAVLLIEKAFGIRFSDLDRKRMDIKPDVNTMRVLYRMGLATSEKEGPAVAAARTLNPDYPGEIDAPLWKIGRT